MKNVIRQPQIEEDEEDVVEWWLGNGRYGEIVLIAKRMGLSQCILEIKNGELCLYSEIFEIIGLKLDNKGRIKIKGMEQL